MTAQAFKAGDTVRLKSGGPLMTVELVHDNYGSPQVSCTWFEKTKLERGGFVPDALKISDDSYVLA